MADPLTLAVVAGAVVTEGIKFLYGQAAEAIKRWRDKGPTAKTASADATPPQDVFVGSLAPLQFHFEQVAQLEPRMLSLRRALSDYADGLTEVSNRDEMLMQTVDAFRQTMEAVYQQRLTFKGEQRPPSGPVVNGSIDVKVVEGVAAGVEARLIAAGRIAGHATAERVERGGLLAGVRADTIGGKS